jgi:uncharacterized protein (TIGR00725 family)
MRAPAIAVCGPARATPAEVDLARALGEAIARRGWTLLTGGRRAGVMDAASAAAAAAGGLVVGILPDSRSEASPDLGVAIVTDLGSGRNNVLVLSADVVVAAGAGSAGTISEIALGSKGGKPVIVVTTDETARAFLARLPGVELARDAAAAIAALERLLG